MANVKDPQYDEYELELLEYMESGEAKSVSNEQELMTQLKSASKNHISKKKPVNIRILESDLEKLKTKALVEGIPYQTLINSVLHKYVNGTLVPR